MGRETDITQGKHGGIHEIVSEGPQGVPLNCLMGFKATGSYPKMPAS